MQDDITPAVSGQPKAARKKRRMNIKLSKRTIKVLVGLIVVVGLLAGVYYAGDHHGASRQKAYDAKHPLSALRPNGVATTPITNRWTAIGTVTEVTDKLVKIKDAKGIVQEAIIDKDTAFTDKTGKKVDIKSVKKDVRVIASGTKDDKGKQTATRIRIQS